MWPLPPSARLREDREPAHYILSFSVHSFSGSQILASKNGGCGVGDILAPKCCTQQSANLQLTLH